MARPWVAPALAIAAPVLLFMLVPPLTKSGLWDPYELNVAELSRRISLNMLGGSGLSLDGADNSLPHLNDLGRPQLPFTSIALGFRLFGLHEWAGRLPLALWGVAGVVATYAWVARLFDKRAGLYAAIALTTMPLYFVQARSMLGDVCAMAGLAMAFGGLVVAVFDRDEDGPARLGQRLPWLAMAALGLFVGFETRGGLLGLAVPLAGVGFAWGITRVSAASKTDDGVGDAVGALALVAGVTVGVMALRVIGAPGEHKDLSLWVGAMLHVPPKYPTFDFTIAAVGHSIAPWSAFLPFAFGRLFLTGPVASGVTRERESLGRVALLVGLSVVVVAHGLLAARTELVAFTGPALCAVVCAVAIRDLERGASSSIAIGIGTLLLAAVLHHDFHELPDKAFQAFGVSGATFPESYADRALTLWWIALGGFAVCTLLTWIERDPDRKPFDVEGYKKVFNVLRTAWDGSLAMGYMATLAGAAVASLIVVVGTRMHAHWLPPMSSTIRVVVLNAWWVLAVTPLTAIFGLLGLADVWSWAFRRGRPFSRASGMVVGGAVVGFVLCFFYYPALANQLSPKEVFESYAHVCPGEPLGLLGVGGRTSAYYAGGQPQTLRDAPAAFEWLSAAKGGSRRCLAMKADDLAKLNQLWREKGSEPRANLPVLDARSSQILLAASSLAGEANQNPLGSMILSEMPHPQRPLDVNLDDKLQVLGSDLTDAKGHLVPAVTPGGEYHLRIYYKVLATITDWPNAFLHIDGSSRRHGADHKVMNGKYPMSLWLPGDLLADDYEVKLEPNFTPGNYTAYFGFASGDKCTDRLAVKSGPSDGCNRVNAGPIQVR